MYIQKAVRHPQPELFDQLRKVHLIGQPHILPYVNAKFEVRLASPKDFQPSALYVLQLELSFLSLLLDQLSAKLGGIRKLDTLLEYTDEFGMTYRMIPPLVEYTDFGQWMVLDGEHRSFIASHRGVKIPMLFVSGVDLAAPYPCTPLPEGWASVTVHDTVPVFKRYSRAGLNDTPQTALNLHRDLSAFGSKGVRKPHSPI